MLSRRAFSWIGFVSLGASISLASACSSGNSSTGFYSASNDNNGGGGNSSNGGNNSNGGNSNNGNSGTNYGNNTQNTGNGNHASSNPTGTGAASNNTTGGNTGTGTGPSTGTGTGTSAATSTGCPEPASCSASTTGGMAIDACYQSTVGMGGYAYSTTDGVSTGCVSSTALCGSGMLADEGATYANWGAAIGINVGQSAGSMANAGVAVTASGLTWGLASGAQLPNGVQVSVTDGNGTQYCYRTTTIPSGMTTTPWSSFNTLCYNTPPDGGAYMSSDMIEKVQFQAITSMTAAPWSMCVSAISF